MSDVSQSGSQIPVWMVSGVKIRNIYILRSDFRWHFKVSLGDLPVSETGSVKNFALRIGYDNHRKVPRRRLKGAALD